MIIAMQEPQVVFPEGFDEPWESEIPVKGYLNQVTVRLEEGRSYLVNFIDPVRLSQDLEGETKAGRPYFAEPGLIVLREVTTQEILTAVKALWSEGFFENLLSLPDLPHQNGTSFENSPTPGANQPQPSESLQG